MVIASLVSSTKGSTKIKIRCFLFTEEKKEFIRKIVKERELFMPQMGYGGIEWPYLYVRGKQENIEGFFNDLKEYFLLPPFYVRE